jgi:hypothetical protein
LRTSCDVVHVAKATEALPAGSTGQPRRADERVSGNGSASVSGLERWTPVSGLLFVVLSLAAWLLFIGAPGVDASAADAAAFVTDHRLHLLTAAFLTGLALVAFLCFLGVLFTAVRGAGEPELAVVAVSGGVVAGVLLVLIVAIPAALAFNTASTADPQMVKAIYDLVWPLQVLIPFPSAVVVGAVSLASLRSRAFPSVIGWAGIASTIAVLIGGTTWSRTGHWSPSHGYGYAALFVFLSWVVVTSALLLWRARREPRDARHPTIGRQAAPASE